MTDSMQTIEMDVEPSIEQFRSNPAEFMSLWNETREALFGNGDLVDASATLLDFLSQGQNRPPANKPKPFSLLGPALTLEPFSRRLRRNGR
jgi:hypothetical protein